MRTTRVMTIKSMVLTMLVFVSLPTVIAVDVEQENDLAKLEIYDQKSGTIYFETSAETLHLSGIKEEDAISIKITEALDEDGNDVSGFCWIRAYQEGDEGYIELTSSTFNIPESVEGYVAFGNSDFKIEFCRGGMENVSSLTYSLVHYREPQEEKDSPAFGLFSVVIVIGICVGIFRWCKNENE